MIRGLALALLPIAALAGCAGPIETRVNSSSDENIAVQEFMLTQLPKNSSAELIEARSLVAASLQEQAMVQKDGADALLTVTISDRPAKIGIRSGDRAISSAKKQKPLQNCDDREYRLTMQLTRTSDGARLYSGEAAEYHCHASLLDTLPTLVSVLVADMNAPRGAKRRRRLGKD